ncbi:MAG: hypothetical protein AAFQ94_19360 [Bacteroidota bacterium]
MGKEKFFPGGFIRYSTNQNNTNGAYNSIICKTQSSHDSSCPNLSESISFPGELKSI